MSSSEVIINEQALTDVASSLRNYVASYREAIESAIRSIKANSCDWGDEDFSSLVSAISSFLQDVEGIENETNQLVERINNKISAIHVLHSMKI